MMFKNDCLSTCVKIHRFLTYSSSPNLLRKVSFSSSAEPSETQTEKLPENDWFNTIADADIDERIVPKPVSVMPDHLPQTRRRIKQKPWWKFRHFVDINTLPLETEEYTKEPQYPKIYDPSKSGIKNKIRLDWYNAIRKLPSAEEKIYEITKHYGHLSYIIEPVMKQYNLLPIQQYITRTHLINSLPDDYNTENIQLDEGLKQVVLSAILKRIYSTKNNKPSVNFSKNHLSLLGFANEENSIQTLKEEDILTDVIQHIRNFYGSNSQISDIQVDYNPFVGTSWWLRDFTIPFKKKKWFKEDKIDQCFTYKSTHGLHIRTEFPLPEIVPLDHELCVNSEIPEYNFDLLKLGCHLRRHNILSLPGFWPDKSGGFDFPNLICHSRESLRLREKVNMRSFNDTQDVLDGMAILSSFSWLTSIANNLGFTIYDKLTYPLVNHVISTDGQFWSFHVYQLNNHSFHSDVDKGNICNLCWSSGDLKLFEKYENGTLIGLNDDVLKILIKFLTIPIQSNTDLNLRPYLGVDMRSQTEKDELSYSLRRKFVNTTDSYIARRKKTNLWETIYKNHKDAPFDFKRTRPKLEFKYPPFFK